VQPALNTRLVELRFYKLFTSKKDLPAHAFSPKNIRRRGNISWLGAVIASDGTQTREIRLEGEAFGSEDQRQRE
jgi:hypothetical protein